MNTAGDPGDDARAGGPQPVPRATHRHHRAWLIAVSALAVVLLAGAVGFVVGRATEKAATPSGFSSRWQPLPPAPITGRSAEAVVWTGTELIVASGLTRSGGGAGGEARDGAASNCATRTWRTIAPPPAGLVGGAAAWTGDTMIVWTGNAVDGPAVGAVYDPRSDSWQRLPAGPLGPREGNASVWTGKELLVIGGHRGDGAPAGAVAAAVNPRTGSWRVLKGFDHLTFFGGPSGTVWDGHEAFVAGNLSLCPERGSACNQLRPILVAYNPATDTWGWRTITPGPSPLNSREGSAVVWTGTDLIAWSGREYKAFNPTPADGASLTLGE